ncbi:hypothetical protein ASG11_14450 [Sphingomonas sp. Leaf357]|uniref:hypothetical protein n=1 Tax=Sphingomonas sp. Leaf357 TaxID=1736350 RepID=UPI00070110BB|nr:hypothetical protein [Sphingomonas sp. Leaf357]KQS02006.1 hypothetical protein ASG11_14450 [Sphingomonas sp. Leaf357]
MGTKGSKTIGGARGGSDAPHAIAEDWIAGGTNMPGIASEVFAMPPGLTIRYDQPAADLADYITGYHVYTAHGPHAAGQVDWFLPGTANVRIALDAAPFSVAIGKNVFDPVPDVSLFGPTSQALRATTNGGVLIGFGISALGWSRLFPGNAADVRDRVLPLEQAMTGDFPARLLAALYACEREDMVAPTLDRLLRAELGPTCPDEPLIRRLMALITRDGPVEIPAAAAELGIEQHSMRRLSIRHFGFPPKLLLRRARFLRSFLRISASRDAADYSLLDGSYFDVSHFLRDANAFLGMTPRRFVSLNTPFLDASLRARHAVLGTATQALHDPNAVPNAI